MTEEEFKKAMGKTIIFIVIMIIILIGLGIFIFNKSGKSTSIFESETAKEAFEKKVDEVNAKNLPKEEVKPEEKNETQEPPASQETAPETQAESGTENTEANSQPEENV